MADGDGDQEVEPVDMQNKSDTLITVSIASENQDSGEILRVRLGGMRLRADDTGRPGHRTDVSGGQMDELKGQKDSLNASNKAKAAGMSDGEGAGTYLDTRGVKRVIDATDGIGSQSDVSRGTRMCHGSKRMR